LLTLGFEVHGFALQQGKRRKGEGTPGGCSSPLNGPTKRAAARPAVAAGKKLRESEREGRGRGTGTMRSSMSVGDSSGQQEIGQPI